MPLSSRETEEFQAHHEMIRLIKVLLSFIAVCLQLLNTGNMEESDIGETLDLSCFG